MIPHLTNLINEFDVFKNISGVIHVGGHTGEEIPLYMENKWEKSQKLTDKMNAFAKELNINIVTAKQIPRPHSVPFDRPMRTGPDVVIIDYLNLIQ